MVVQIRWQRREEMVLKSSLPCTQGRMAFGDGEEREHSEKLEGTLPSDRNLPSVRGRAGLEETLGWHRGP